MRGVSVGGVYTRSRCPSSASCSTPGSRRGRWRHRHDPAVARPRRSRRRPARAARHPRAARQDAAAARRDAGARSSRISTGARGAVEAAALAARDRGDRHVARRRASSCAATCSCARCGRSIRCRRSAYLLVRRVAKLRPEFRGLTGPRNRRTAARRRGRDSTTRTASSSRTRPTRWSGGSTTRPSCYTARVLIIECTFLDERKSLEAARAGCHIHLDETDRARGRVRERARRADARLAAVPARRGRGDPRRARAAAAARAHHPVRAGGRNWPG